MRHLRSFGETISFRRQLFYDVLNRDCVPPPLISFSPNETKRKEEATHAKVTTAFAPQSTLLSAMNTTGHQPRPPIIATRPVPVATTWCARSSREAIVASMDRDRCVKSKSDVMADGAVGSCAGVTLPQNRSMYSLGGKWQREKGGETILTTVWRAMKTVLLHVTTRNSISWLECYRRRPDVG
ncbi:hypothetical protein GW17_00049642 [Ensete ventricosum]|nr:hypothetical protein GW17_00049642 [Ensete ventricosum]